VTLYFSYPEWFIVWSYEERAQYLPKNLPSGFHTFLQIGQNTGGRTVSSAVLTQSRHQFNFGDHLSSFVLGGSFALEYASPARTNKPIGRLSEWTSSHELVEEDAYGARVALRIRRFRFTSVVLRIPFSHTR